MAQSTLLDAMKKYGDDIEDRVSDIYLLTDEEESVSRSFMDPVYKKWPNLRVLVPDIKVRDSRHRYADPSDANRPLGHRGALEYYSPNETGPPRFLGDRTNRPYVGNRTIELFQPLHERDEDVTQAIFGDILHALPDVSPRFASLKREFGKTVLSDKNLEEESRRRFRQNSSNNPSDTRTFNEWFETNDLDAYIRGLLSPDKADNWRDVYSEKMRKIGREMMRVVE
jgi:hypothetical protein